MSLPPKLTTCVIFENPSLGCLASRVCSVLLLPWLLWFIGSKHTILTRQVTSPFCPDYFEHLIGPTRARHLQKLKLCGNEDPYTPRVRTGTMTSTDLFPNIMHGNIINYLVPSTSYLSLQVIKAYKSLLSHNYYMSGWVKSPPARALSRNKTNLVSEICAFHYLQYFVSCTHQRMWVHTSYSRVQLNISTSDASAMHFRLAAFSVCAQKHRSVAYSAHAALKCTMLCSPFGAPFFYSIPVEGSN